MDKEQRDALKNSDFAVPSKRELPIHDEKHVRLAWDMVERTEDLSDSERASARTRILKKAKELGIDTKDWKTGHEAYAIPEVKKLPLWDRDHVLMASNAINYVRGITEEQRLKGRLNISIAAAFFGLDVPSAKRTHLHFDGMALDMPIVKGHPNRHPFTGVMTRLDIPSDFPVGGTTRKKVIIPVAVAEKALPTLLGMALDYTQDFDGHDRKSKIGIITEAYVGEEDELLGTPLHIAGFFYAADFPDEVALIQSKQNALGFSYEAEATVEDMDTDPWVCASCEFTGAAVLLKDRAAFTKTSLQASQGEIQMTPEELKALQDKALALEAENAALKAAAEKTTLEAASLQKLVKPHADALRQCASAMSAAGIGADSKNGHASHLNRMADSMEAEAVMGRIPSMWNDHSWMYASKDEATLKAEAVKNDEIASLKTQVSDLNKKSADLQAAAEASASASKSGRKSLNASASALLKRVGLDSTSESFSATAISDACRKAGLTSADALALKLNLKAEGLLTA